jgi:hypothetical protein
LISPLDLSNGFPKKDLQCTSSVHVRKCDMNDAGTYVEP